MSYPKSESRLYKMTSPKKLSEVLLMQLSKIRTIESLENNYRKYNCKKTQRPIQEPKTLLAAIHKRLAILLARIETPHYLHSAVKGKSYITNAKSHDPNFATVKIDIRKFYPSIRIQQIFHFFLDDMKCNREVAGILSNLVTVDDHLPTGSSVSPILSFFAYQKMFDEIEQIAIKFECVFTCYIDDMVFTGRNASHRLIYEVLLVVRRYRLWGHKTRLYQAHQDKEITGLIVSPNGPYLPNKRKANIYTDLELLGRSSDEGEQLVILTRVSGRLHEAAQIDSSWKPEANKRTKEMTILQRRLRQR